MQKASFDSVNAESRDAVGRWLGCTLVSNETYLYSQHIKGTENIIADTFSQDFHRSDQTLTKIFQPSSTTTDIGIVPHQTSSQERYLMDIIASGSLDAYNGITKATTTKKSETGIGGAHFSNIQ